MQNLAVQLGVHAGNPQHAVKDGREYLSTIRSVAKIKFRHLLPLIIICIGILLRLNQYLFNRSLWMDEAFVANNFLHETWAELLQAPMEYTETMMAPVGFMVLVKLSIILFGNRDIVLRIYPFLSSLLALPLFYKAAQSYTSRPAAIIALFLFATSKPLIYQASELKPYSSDVTFALAILLLASTLAGRQLTVKRIIALAISGALVVWFSFPAAFMLAAFGSYLALWQAKRKQWNAVGAIAVVSILWLISFALQYKVAVGPGVEVSSTGEALIQFWQRRNAFMPFPFSTAIVTWSLSSFLSLFQNPAEWLNMAFLVAVFCYLVGAIFMMARKRGAFFILTMPIVFAAVASYFRVYPFWGRMVLFLLPSIFVTVGEGIAQLSLTLARSFKNQARIVVLSQVMLALLLVNYVPYHATREEVRPILEYVQTHRWPQDKIYVFFAADPAFRYYSSFYGLNYEDCNIIVPIPEREFMDTISYFRSKQKLEPTAVDETQCILGVSVAFDESRSELAKLKGAGRIWFIFSHASSAESEFLRYLDSMGIRLDEIILHGASAYLYDL